MHPGDQLPGIERLGKIIIGAQLKADDPIDVITAGGEHYDRDRGTRSNLSQNVESVDSRQHDIEDDQVIPIVYGKFRSMLAIVAGFDIKTFRFQIIRQKITEFRIVINYQNVFHGGLLL